MRHHDRFNGILSSLHEAALDGALWPLASASIDEAFGVRGNALVMGRGHSQVDAEIFFARFCWCWLWSLEVRRGWMRGW